MNRTGATIGAPVGYWGAGGRRLAQSRPATGRFRRSPRLDVHQATGGLRKEQANLIGHTKMDIFASMLGTLQLQLRARYWLVNCKSEWHRLIVELARTGRCAGGAEELVVQCSESKAMHMKDGERMTEFVPVQ